MFLLFKIINTLAESLAVTIIYFEKKHKRNHRECKSLAKKAVIFRNITILIYYIVLPFFFIFNKADEKERALKIAFLELCLMEALSYYEWMDFEEIWNKIKDDEKLHACFKNMEQTKIKRMVFTLTIFLAQLGIFKIRTETKDEYIVYRMKLKIVHGDENKKITIENIPNEHKEKLGKDYDNAEHLPGYERFARGIRILFLRKPLGTKKNSGEKDKILSYIPGFN